MFYINHFEYCDLLIFSVLMNMIMVVFLFVEQSRQSHSTKVFRIFILSVAAVGILEILSWVFAVEGNENYHTIHYISNAVFLSFNVVPVACGLRYLDYIITVSKERNRKKFLFYLMPVYVNIALVIVNLFVDGFLFRVDELNEYHRGIGVYIENAFALLFVIGAVIGFYRTNKHMITGRMTQSILVLTGLPILGVILQMAFYGFSMGIPSYTLAIFITFMLMEKNELLKDPLTLLNSRVQMEMRLQHKLKGSEPFTAMMIDVNGFKQINDVYGHTTGDIVLKDVAKILFSGANFEDYVCRFGGDEFFIILESVHDIGGAYIRRIEHRLKEYSADKPFQTSLSYGYVYVDHSIAYRMEELIEVTDRRMYQDKISDTQ